MPLSSPFPRSVDWTPRLRRGLAAARSLSLTIALLLAITQGTARLAAAAPSAGAAGVGGAPPAAAAKKSPEPVAKAANGDPVVAKPPPWTQKQKTSAERGVNPCNTPDPGFGSYSGWNREVSIGQMIAPKQGAVNARGEFDVMIHFHGHEPARKEWVQVMQRGVLVGIDLGLGSGPYESTFQPRDAFRTLLQSIEKAVAKHSGKPNAHVRRIGLSAWSAGYGAIQSILSDPWAMEHVDTVVLLDGLHCGYRGPTLNALQIQPFIEFAKLAAASKRLMVVSHSSIIPPGYASTTETANFLVAKVGGKPERARPRKNDPMGLELISRYSRGNFHVRGFSGNDKMDHCAHLGFFRDVLRAHVVPRWSSRIVQTR
ncbi:MAG TPA: hypothetical protein VFQ61_22945 [Polyangiaceae bacterium]|nr:hypothetical protein [Polyangiaceae bacterium]